MNKLSYHLILVNSSLRVLIDQIEQLCECIEMNPPLAQTKIVTSKKGITDSDPPPVLRCDKQSIIGLVYESIKRTRKGIAFVQIKKKTGFNRRQIANAIYKLKEKGMIEAIRRGTYIIGGRNIK